MEVEVLQAAVREAQGVRQAVVLVAVEEEVHQVEEAQGVADQAVVGADRAVADQAVAGQAVEGEAQVVQEVQADREQVVVQEVQADRAAHQAQAGVVAQAVVAAKAEGQGPVVEVADQEEVAAKAMGKAMGKAEGQERAAAGLKVGPVRDEVELISISQ